MPISTTANLPILTFNHVFPNKEGLERLEKFVLKRKSISEKFHNFQNTQEKDVQLWHHLKEEKEKEKTLEIVNIQKKRGGDGGRR